MTIGVVIRDISYLKLSHPICEHLSRLNVPYIIYHWDAYRGSKQYNRASLTNLNKSSPTVIKNAKKVKAFASDKQLLQQLAHDRITKLVSVEIWLWAKSYIKRLKEQNIKTYSVMYLTDSIWQSKESVVGIDRIYYSTQHTMNVHHDFAQVTYDKQRDRVIGSPIFDPIPNSPSKGKNILVLLPNLRSEHVPVSFGNTSNFVSIIKKLSEAGNLIFKTRKKQWIPNEIKQYSSEIIDDGDIMYPPVSVGLFKKCYTTVMFYSSGIFEAVYGGNYVLNVPLPLKRWGWSGDKLKQYFSVDNDNLYQFSGVVESVSQKTILQDDWKFNPKQIDPTRRKEWVDRFIGPNTISGAEQIAVDIIKG